jgi:hypothetical protein
MTNTGSQYQGSDINTGTQTPEGVTSTTDIFDSGIAGGSGGVDNANA